MFAAAWLLTALGSAWAAAQPAAEGGARTGALLLPDPSRPLTAAEAEKLVAHVVMLLDKRARWGKREQAASVLGQQIRHRAALPALRFVMHDEQEDRTLRIKAAREMVHIGAPQVVGDIIQLLRAKDRNLRFNAWEMLSAQYPSGRQFGFDPDGSVEENDPAIKRWEKWWEANKHTFELTTRRTSLY